ncbi:hypothetical protein GCM10010970_16230 [Silvimonas iriomotensis]|uniref:Uncharacterized protein n=1 Tax=Silvimonas iriomotensis TaxID=449662 RepID=A0ABQ2P8E1_9NEIS|nr:hypothetical protein GCM10010970_16230 [Silvimonas iriomotensis]
MPGVGQQGQRARPDPAGHFYQHEGKDDDEGRGNAALVSHAMRVAKSMVVIMMVAVAVIMRVIVRSLMAGVSVAVVMSAGSVVLVRGRGVGRAVG